MRGLQLVIILGKRVGTEWEGYFWKSSGLQDDDEKWDLMEDIYPSDMPVSSGST